MKILLNTNKIEVKIKNSRFIAVCSRIENENDVRVMLNNLRAEHPKANHIVYAYQAGSKSESTGFSDDGEPSGTAGRPVFDILKGAELTNTLISVIRYFGGIKLGTGGLVKAYAKAAREVLESAETEILIPQYHFSVSCPYNFADQLKYILDKHDAYITSEEYLSDVTFTGLIPESELENCSSIIENKSNGSRISFRTETTKRP